MSSNQWKMQVNIHQTTKANAYKKEELIRVKPNVNTLILNHNLSLEFVITTPLKMNKYTNTPLNMLSLRRRNSPKKCALKNLYLPLYQYRLNHKYCIFMPLRTNLHIEVSFDKESHFFL